MSTFQTTNHTGIATPRFLPLLSSKLRAQPPEQAIHWTLLSLDTHIDLVHEWVALPYAQAFWQMDHLSKDELREHYRQVLACGQATSLIGYYNGKPACQVEVYAACADEISRYYDAEPSDIGIHFLMAPLQADPVPGLSLLMMRSVLGLLLRLPGITRIMGEPDTRNTKANSLVRKAGFRFLHPIHMSYKDANLYCCTPTSFNQPA